jgi:hypothetical protein
MTEASRTSGSYFSPTPPGTIHDRLAGGFGGSEGTADEERGDAARNCRRRQDPHAENNRASNRTNNRNCIS